MRKYVSLTVLGLVYLFLTSSMIKEKGCEVFLSLTERNQINIYKTTSKKTIIRTMGHDLVNEDYLSFIIHNSNDSMYQVTALQSISGEKIDGWISKKTKISIFYKQVGNPILLYKLPKNNSAVLKAKYTSNELLVLDCKKSWLKVTTTNSKGNISGWLPEELQCSNPYTTCN